MRLCCFYLFTFHLFALHALAVNKCAFLGAGSAGTVAFNCFQDAHCKLHFRKGMKVCIDGLHHKADNMVTN